MSFPAMKDSEYDVLRIMMHCIRMTPTRRRLITTFHIRCISVVSVKLMKPHRIRLLTPPLSVFDTKTNMSWYLYTQELIQKMIAEATTTRGARGAKKRPTAPMNSCTDD